jgi:phosphatidylserine/phosphatidylglycerophosphate/cardiolipin synthase-like enzyme
METSIRPNEVLIGSQYPEKVGPLIDKAVASIDVLMFDWRWYKNDFSNPVQIFNQCFVRAVRRGVKVRAIINYQQNVELLKTLGIDAKLFTGSDLLHAKLLIIDKKYVVIGSHNFTANAFESNIETSLFVSDQKTAEQYQQYFNNLW